MQITTSLKNKAERLVWDDKVTRIGTKGFAFMVQGDSGPHTVWLSFPEEASGRCDCPANQNSGKTCSHILAASIFYLASKEEFEAADRRIGPGFDSDPFAGLS